MKTSVKNHLQKSEIMPLLLMILYPAFIMVVVILSLV